MRGRSIRKLQLLFALTLAAAISMLWNGHRHVQEQQHSQQSQQEVSSKAHRGDTASHQSPLQPSPVQQDIPATSTTTTTTSLSVPSQSNWTSAAQAFSRLSTFSRIPRHIYFGFNATPHDGRPSLDEIVNKTGHIVGDPQALLDVAIIGFGKAGTTTIVDWLAKHPRIAMYPKEVYHLGESKPVDFIKKLYMLPTGRNLIRGYKSPNDLTMPHVMQGYLRRYWPATKLIVGIRHPVHWFQSLYNFRVQNLPKTFNVSSFPLPERLIGPCRSYSQNICTAKGEFALFLRNLGKTVLDDNSSSGSGSGSGGGGGDRSIVNNNNTLKLTMTEKKMYKVAKLRIPDDIKLLPNPVFLFETSQLADTNATRAAAFCNDLSRFVGLPANESLSESLPHHKPGKVWSPARQQVLDAAKIDICDSQHLSVRRDLMRIARTSSVWIRRFFLQQTEQRGITVSSPAYFDEIMEDWMNDPCPGDGTKGAGARLLEAFDKDEKHAAKDRMEVAALAT